VVCGICNVAVCKLTDNSACLCKALGSSCNRSVICNIYKISAYSVTSLKLSSKLTCYTAHISKTCYIGVVCTIYNQSGIYTGDSADIFCRINVFITLSLCVYLSVYRNISDSSFFSYNSKKTLTISFVMIVALLIVLFGFYEKSGNAVTFSVKYTVICGVVIYTVTVIIDIIISVTDWCPIFVFQVNITV